MQLLRIAIDVDHNGSVGVDDFVALFLDIVERTPEVADTDDVGTFTTPAKATPGGGAMHTPGTTGGASAASSRGRTPVPATPGGKPGHESR